MGALLLRGIWLPVQLYSQLIGIKSGLLHADVVDMRARIQEYARQGVGAEEPLRTETPRRLSSRSCRS